MANLAFLHGGNIYEIEKKFKKEVIDFSANVNPLGLPSLVKNTISMNFDKILHYPDPKARKLTQKIAKYWGINEQNVLVGNGSVELLYLIMSTYRPKVTLIPVPAFSEYERAARSLKSRIQFLKLKEKENFKLNLSPDQKFWCEGNNADILFLCNPNNPTGNLIMEDYKAIKRPSLCVQGLGKLLIVDESFMDFLPNQINYTLIWEAVKNRKIVVLRTFTKFFALPGLRIGYIIAHKDIINKLRRHQPPWSTNSLAQIAAELILNDKEYINRTYKLIEKERDFLNRQLAEIEGLKPYPSVANFLLIKIKKAGITSKFLRESLINKGILIRDCSNFRNLSNKYIRVAVRSHKENLRLITALKEVV